MTEPVPHPSTAERIVATNGIDLRVVYAGEGPPVILAHGWPELSYSWRHQLPALADAGFHAVAPDMRGYGGSSKPGEITDYDIVHLTGDLIGLLDDLGEERAVFVGHDWGSMVVGSLARMHPDRVAGVVAMSVPILAEGPMGVIQMLRAASSGTAFFYMLYFQEPGVADADLARDPATTMRRVLGGLSVPEGETLDMSGLSAPDGTGFVDRLPPPRGAAALAQPRGAGPLRHRVHPHRVHGRGELVPQPRPQLGDHTPARRCAQSPVPRCSSAASRTPCCS